MEGLKCLFTIFGPRFGSCPLIYRSLWGMEVCFAWVKPFCTSLIIIGHPMMVRQINSSLRPLKCPRVPMYLGFKMSYGGVNILIDNFLLKSGKSDLSRIARSWIALFQLERKYMSNEILYEDMISYKWPKFKYIPHVSNPHYHILFFTKFFL